MITEDVISPNQGNQSKQSDPFGPASIQSPKHLWEMLKHSTSDNPRTDFYHAWLAIQCIKLPNVVQAVLILKKEQGPAYVPVAKWPGQAKAERLGRIAEKALSKGCGLLHVFDDQSGHVAAAYPVFIHDELAGVVGLEISSKEQTLLNQVMMQLEWSVGWIEALENRLSLQTQKAKQQRLESAIRILALIQSEPVFGSSALAFVTELATQMQCDRVSIGFPKGRKIKIEALSHSAHMDERTNLMSAISKAMEEAVLFGEDIQYAPAHPSELSHVEHERLAKNHDAQAILTLPIYANQRYYCVLTLERFEGKLFSEEDIEYCRSIAVLNGPALEEKRLNARPLVKKVYESCKIQIKRLIGPRYFKRKLFVLVCAALVLFFSTATGTYRVSSQSTLEGQIQRVISAPFAGYIKSVGPSAGEIVQADDLLFTLDDKDFRLERITYLGEIDQFRKQMQNALAEYNRAEASITKAQLAQANAKYELVEEKLQRAQVKAPFTGVLIEGDLSQRVGGYVERGEELFKLAPLEAYRLILNVDEHQIADIQIGQSGELVLASIPNHTFDIQVTQITSETRAADGLNTFRVEAELVNLNKADRLILRPGMEGVGKISIGERKLIDIWTRSLRHWLRLFAWRWIP